MIESIIYNYLKQKMSIPVYMEYPSRAAKTMIIVEKVGSGLEDHVHTALITIQSYSTSLFNTADLNETVKTAMFGIVELDKICKCELNSDYNYPDVERNQYRYQALFEITYLK